MPVAVDIDDTGPPGVEVSNMTIGDDDSGSVRDGLHDLDELIQVPSRTLVDGVNDPP
jgi:hypothetical protein